MRRLQPFTADFYLFWHAQIWIESNLRGGFAFLTSEYCSPFYRCVLC